MSELSLLLFAVDPDVVQDASRAGVAGIVVDWERAGKARRQQGADTEINHHTTDDLARVRKATSGLVLCRINGLHRRSRQEIDRAIDLGADEVLLPMVRGPREVEVALELVRGRRPLGILIETEPAVQSAKELCALPIARVYVGLNDLAIDRGAANIFGAVADGTVERLRRHCSVPFGFGGLTLPEAGWPVPCRLLIAEMARLETTFSFLRRSFYRDLDGRCMEREVPRLLAAIEAAGRRPLSTIASEQAEFVSAVAAWPPATRPVAAIAQHA